MTTYNIPGQSIPSDPSIASGDAALQAEIDQLTARVTKLEAGTSVPPPSTFPPPPAGAIPVPPSIDPTGQTDVYAKYQQFLTNLKQGTAANPTVVYEAPGSVYLRTGTGLNLDGLSYLNFWSYGSITKSTAPNVDLITNAGIFAGSSKPAAFIKKFGGQVLGPNPNGATATAYSGAATACSIWFGGGSHDIELASVDLVSPWGHLIYIESGGNYNFHDWTGEKAGLMGLAVRSTTGLVSQRFTLTDTAVSPIDIEDAIAGEPIVFAISDFTLNRWGWYPKLTAHAIQGDGGTGAKWGACSVVRGTFTGGSQGGPMQSTDAWVSFWGSDAKANLTLASLDLSALPQPGWAMRMMNATGTLSNSKAPGASTILHAQGGSMVLSGNQPAT
jgi:hypothetical protein